MTIVEISKFALRIFCGSQLAGQCGLVKRLKKLGKLKQVTDGDGDTYFVSVICTYSQANKIGNKNKGTAVLRVIHTIIIILIIITF